MNEDCQKFEESLQCEREKTGEKQLKGKTDNAGSRKTWKDTILASTEGKKKSPMKRKKKITHEIRDYKKRTENQEIHLELL